MKITSVQAYKTNPQAFISQNKAQQSNVMSQHYINSQKPALTLVDVNYNQLLINKKTTNFSGINKTSLKLLEQPPLEDKLAYLFNSVIDNDLIITGKNLQDAKKAIYNSLDKIKQVIKKAYFVEDNSLTGTLGFFKNETKHNINIINPNEFDLSIISTQKTIDLKNKEIAYLTPEDLVIINGKIIPIKDKPDNDLSFLKTSFVKIFDFTQDTEQRIEQINKKNIASLIPEAKKKAHPVTFKDVGGQDKLIDELKKSIIYPINHPKGFETLDVNHGFILYGPPGTGKTHIARALANEANANFVGLNGLELESKWIGESEANWRNLFESAKENQPTIIFIDEFDAIARARGGIDEFGDKVVNQILTLMTDIDNEGSDVYVIAATNNYKALDPAIKRSGRFGKHLEVGLPDAKGLKQIFDIHAKKKPIDPKVNKDEIATRLFDLKASGADVKYIINEAHINGYQRAGIFEKMENNTLKDSDIDNFTILPEDIDKAIKAFIDSKQGNTRKPIGYTK